MNVGILTAGGCCPGVNEIIKYICKYEKSVGSRVVGFKDGFSGLNKNQRVNLSIHDMKQSCEKVDLEMAAKNMQHLERLYCICGNESMNDVCQLGLDERIDTNIIGIAKSIYNDVPGLECIGFRSALAELTKLIDTIYIEAAASRSLYFLVIPGLHSDDLINHLRYARNNKIIASINTQNNNSITRHMIESHYSTHGYGVVIISEKCDIVNDMPATIINPGNRLNNVDTCLYDGILSMSVARDSFLYAQKNKNFIKGGSSIIKIEDYLSIV